MASHPRCLTVLWWGKGCPPLELLSYLSDSQPGWRQLPTRRLFLEILYDPSLVPSSSGVFFRTRLEMYTALLEISQERLERCPASISPELDILIKSFHLDCEQVSTIMKRMLMNFETQDEIIVDEEIFIRKIRKEDLISLFEVYSDPEVMKFASEPAFCDLSMMDNFFESVLHGYHTKEYFEFAILYKFIPIGTCSFHSYDKEKKGIEIGYLLNKKHWGKGIMTRYLIKFIESISLELDVHSIIADIDLENERSIKLVRKLGFLLLCRKPQNMGLVHP